MKLQYSLISSGILLSIPLLSLGTKNKPNIVFIIADDLGYGDLSCYGQQKFQTPNIDRLAENGLKFTQAYSGSSVSAPSRASLLTGFHTGHAPIRGNKEVKPEGQFPLPANTQSIFSIFKEAGYETGAFGKWGLGSPGSEGDPNNQGIDEFFGFNCQLLAHNYYANHLWHNDKRVELPGNYNGGYGVYTQDTIHEMALMFIEENRDQPFFLFLPYILPHAELLVPEDSIIQKFRGQYLETPYKGCDKDCPNFRKGGYCSQAEPHATFAAMIYRLDVYVGQIIKKLEEFGLSHNTLIIFTSDNGPHKEGGADPDFFNSNGIYRGYKRDVYEGGIRVPFIVSWRDTIIQGETDFMYSFWDMLPTFAEMTGKEVKETDGVSLLPTLIGKGKQKEHNYLYFEFLELGGRQAVRQEDWKLVRLNASKGKNSIYELYNIANDPSETQNLLTTETRKVEELKKLMTEAHVFNPAWSLLEEEF